jgi:hypothetical protein
MMVNLGTNERIGQVAVHWTRALRSWVGMHEVFVTHAMTATRGVGNALSVTGASRTAPGTLNEAVPCTLTAGNIAASPNSAFGDSDGTGIRYSSWWCGYAQDEVEARYGSARFIGVRKAERQPVYFGFSEIEFYSRDSFPQEVQPDASTGEVVCPAAMAFPS